MNDISSPLNAQEQYLYGINMRLNILIDQVSSLVQHLATKDAASVEENTEVIAPPKRTRTKVV